MGGAEPRTDGLKPDPLAEAEARLKEAEDRVREDASQDNLRRLEHWRTVVQALRERAASGPGAPPARPG